LRDTIGADKLDELFGLFRTSWQSTIAEMWSALDAGDLDGLRQLAHRIKGGALNLGLNSVAEGAIAIEGAIRAGATTLTVRPMVTALDEACHETQTALDRTVSPTADAPPN
jgi:hypothetical protein